MKLDEPIQTSALPYKVYSVTDLTNRIKNILEGDSQLSGVWITGEISNLVKAASGHCYFTLKDDKSVVKAALWAGVRRRIKASFANGDLVTVYANISVYPPRGEYQILVNDLRPAGVGALYEAYEKLKKKLSAEGLFEPERKMSLPFIPKGVGIVTSPRGSVIQDIYRVIRRRYPNMPLYLVPAKVQGEGAAEEIVQGIERLDADNRVDLIIIARGGGSLEDLWCFNEESVARAIGACHKPVISAIGHETDTTIADLVADKRAATPSVAGELAVPVKAELEAYLKLQTGRMTNLMKRKIAFLRQVYSKHAACRFLTRPELLISERRLNVMSLTRDLENAFKLFYKSQRHRTELAFNKLLALNPEAILKRGYLMASDEEGRVVVSAADLSKEQPLTLAFADGKAEVKVQDIILNKKGR
ncbi:MAG: exodeoxyribonuclease VII large subunit [Candidatus Riflebacteria bacterium]|nr:exodeoxyribonuclease VII large subunit [Candidatus Riflebacteria bacterium]